MQIPHPQQLNIRIDATILNVILPVATVLSANMNRPAKQLTKKGRVAVVCQY
jgi:hypothetical protein